MLKRMILKHLMFNLCLATFLCVGYSSNSQEIVIDTTTKKPLKIISLGDSYTIGASVCDTCRFPEQLKDSLKLKTENDNIVLKVIATTGWTTSALLNALKENTIESDYDLATLLIGVNNQFQRRPFEQFEIQFPELVNKAISYTNGIKGHLIVVSIPDYAYTPYGAGRESISIGIDKYNNFIEAYCKQNDITDIIRLGLDEPNLIASDRLHPSTLAYSKFVNRILPYALKKISYNSN